MIITPNPLPPLLPSPYPLPQTYYRKRPYAARYTIISPPSDRPWAEIDKTGLKEQDWL